MLFQERRLVKELLVFVELFVALRGGGAGRSSDEELEDVSDRGS